MTIIFFTRALPSPIAEELQRQGHQVFESLAISETLALQEQHPDATIVIGSDVDAERARAVQQHHPTMQINHGTTVQDIMWELSHQKGPTVQ